MIANSKELQIALRNLRIFEDTLTALRGELQKRILLCWLRQCQQI